MGKGTRCVARPALRLAVGEAPARRDGHSRQWPWHTGVLVAVLCALALGVAGRALSAPGPDAPIVTDIEFRGSYTASPEFLLKGLHTRVGRPLDLNVIDQDVKRLFEEGRFIATHVEQEPYQDGVRVVFYIEENPTCWRVDYEGRGASAGKLKSVTGLRAGGAVSAPVLREDERKIQEYFQGQGYPSAQVSHKISLVTEPGQQGAVVTYVVERGPKALVKRITFEGAQTLSPRQLRGVMKTKRDHWWTSARFVSKDFQDDLLRVRDYYRTKGWLDAEVTADEPKIIKEGRGVELTVHVVEGPQFVIGDITFKGITAIPAEELLAQLRLHSGSAFSRDRLQSDVRQIERLMGQKGFVNVEVTPQLLYAPEGAVVDLAYNVAEGETVAIDRIDVIGNTKTKSVVILREMKLDPGDRFDRAKVQASAQRLLDTRFFSKVDARLTDTEPPQPGHKNLLVEVEEQDTGRLTGGAGYSTVNSFYAVVSFEQDNFDYRDVPPTAWDWLTPWRWFQGDGQQFRISLSPGSLRNMYEIYFMEPWWLDKPLSLSLNLYLIDSSYFTDYNESRFGFRGGIGRRWDNGFFTEVAYKIDRIALSDVPDTATVDTLAVEGTNWLSGPQVSFGFRRTDSRLLPSKGYNAEVNLELDSGALGSDFDIWKAGLLTQWYRTLHENLDGGKHILGLEGRLGFAGAFGDTEDVPIYERYFAGGSVVRGFAARQLGPRGLQQVAPFPWLPGFTILEESDQPAGGNFLFAGTAEYSFPLFRDEERQSDIIRGVVFFDVGTLEKDLSSGAFGKLRTSAGFGFRFVIPALGQIPVKIDFGFPITKEDKDETELVTFSMGTFF